jgi:hypothetical protein
MNETDRLIDKLRGIEALHAGATTPGERAAAESARVRILERLADAARRDPPVEYKFTFNNDWSRRLFVALLRRYDLDPYRYVRQRYTTVMVRVPVSFVEVTLWPEFLALDNALREHFDALSTRIISEAVSPDISEARERAELPAGVDPR